MSRSPLTPEAFATCVIRFAELSEFAPRLCTELFICWFMLRASSSNDVRAFRPDNVPSCVKYSICLSVAPASLNFARISPAPFGSMTISFTSPRSAFLISSSACAYLASSGLSVPLSALLPPSDVVVSFFDFLPSWFATSSSPFASNVDTPPPCTRTASSLDATSFVSSASCLSVMFSSLPMSLARSYTLGKSAVAFDAFTASVYALFATVDNALACL